MPAPQPIAIAKAVEAVMRKDGGRLVAALIARFGDFQLAEDMLQEAAISALSHWGRTGMPNSPQGWLLTVANRKALDRLRGQALAGRHAAEIALLQDEAGEERDDSGIPEERLRLIFTCCHPALDPKSRVALTLRTLCGLTTGEIARVFLDAEPTMGQRLSRAKAKIAAARIPFVVPGPDAWPERLNSVLTVVYLIFTAGYTQGPGPGRDLCDEAIWLGRMLDALCPQMPEVEGALALMLLTRARASARVGPDGATVPPAKQDRRLWDGAALAEGQALLDAAAQQGAPGPFQLKAALAFAQTRDPVPWQAILTLHDALARIEDTPVTRLNRVVALLEARGPGPAADALAALKDSLDGFQPYHAVRAEVLARKGDFAADAEYARAIALAPTAADGLFLQKRRAAWDEKKGRA